MSDRESTLQALSDCHSFPGPFTFRVIGENSPEFVARVVQAIVIALGTQAKPTIQLKESAHGKHQAIAASVEVGCAEHVLDVYAALKTVPGVRLLL